MCKMYVVNIFFNLYFLYIFLTVSFDEQSYNFDEAPIFYEKTVKQKKVLSLQSYWNLNTYF